MRSMEGDDRYILTQSGVKVGLRTGTPTLEDLALGLSRAPRFTGQGRVFWSVLHHSIFVRELHAADQPRSSFHPLNHTLQLALLLHDAHEAITADVPSPFKFQDTKELQADLDVRIFGAYFPGGYGAYTAFRETVKSYDTRALLAEARLVGPECLDSDKAVAAHFGSAPIHADVETLHGYLARNDRWLGDRSGFLWLKAVQDAQEGIRNG